MERALTAHEAACGERNKSREKWENKTDSDMKALGRAVSKLNLSEARMAGWTAGAAAVGAFIASAVMAWLSKGW